jgi:hypothetical protein
MQRTGALSGTGARRRFDDQRVSSASSPAHADTKAVFTSTPANLRLSCLGLFAIIEILGATLPSSGASSVSSSVTMLLVNVLFFPLRVIRVQLTLFFTPWFYV